MDSESLGDYRPAFGAGGYVESRAPVLTAERFRWLWRGHRTELIEAGIAIVIGGRVHVHPARMDEFLLALARERARRLAGRS